MEMGTQLFSQFPVVSIFFHSFLWYLVIQHLKDFKGSCPHHCTTFPAWRHNRKVTTAEEVSPAQSRAQKHLGWHRREAGIQKGVLYFPFSPLLFCFIDKTKEHQKKKKKVEYDFPMHLSPSYKPFNSGFCFFHLFTICFFPSSRQWESFKANICYDVISSINISVHISKW